MQLEKLNNIEVKPAKLEAPADDREVRGRELFEIPYNNTMLVARKNSGKSVTLSYILKKRAGPETRVFCFVSTLHRDPRWNEIRRYFERKGINFVGYTSIFDDQTNADQLEPIVKVLQEKDSGDSDDDDTQEITTPESFMRFLEKTDKISIKTEDKNPATKKDKKTARKDKYKSPDLIFVFDDLGDEIIKSKSLLALLKKNRHFRSQIYISSQALLDIMPGARKQIEYWIAFGGLNLEKIKVLYADANISIPFEQFLKVYQFATKEKYQFLYIDTTNQTFRKNFSHKIKFREE